MLVPVTVMQSRRRDKSFQNSGQFPPLSKQLLRTSLQISEWVGQSQKFTRQSGDYLNWSTTRFRPASSGSYTPLPCSCCCDVTPSASSRSGLSQTVLVWNQSNSQLRLGPLLYPDTSCRSQLSLRLRPLFSQAHISSESLLTTSVV